MYYLISVRELVPARFALVGTYDELQLVLLQKSVRNVWSEVRSSASQSIRNTAVSRLWVAPQNVENLGREWDST